jgi:hypothetical protein
MAAALCVAFIVIVLIKGVWILAVFGAAMLTLQIINLTLGPRRRRPPAPRVPATAPPQRSAPRSSEAARRRARRGRGR